MKDDRLYLTHNAECVARVQSYTVDGRAAFEADLRTQDAVVRNLQVMAESCCRLSAALLAAHTEIDWRAIRGFRNVVVHDYLRIDLDEIWRIIDEDLPLLGSVVAQELHDLGPSEQDED